MVQNDYVLTDPVPHLYMRVWAEVNPTPVGREFRIREHLEYRIQYVIAL
jgi:hypothetical protein